MDDNNRIAIINKLSKVYVHEHVGLIYNSKFELLIALVLSTKSTDSAVNKVTKDLFIKANTPKKFLSLDQSLIENIIKSVGIFRRKAKNIIEICRILIDKYNGTIPMDNRILESFPGVGKKITNIMLNVAFHKPIIAVDTHVFRVCNRTNFLSGKNCIFLEKRLNLIVAKEFRKKFHYLFLLHGKNVCKAKKPDCKNCLIKDLCEFENKRFY